MRRMSDGPVGEIPRSRPLHHAVPELDAPASVPEVDLVTDLAAPPRAGHDDRDAVQVRLQEPVVAELEDVLSEQPAHDLL